MKCDRIAGGNRQCAKLLKVSGCGAAWLARLLGVQEVPGSNPGSPTNPLRDLRPAVILKTRVGVHWESKTGRRPAQGLSSGRVGDCDFRGLSPAVRTRHPRHSWHNRLIL